MIIRTTAVDIERESVSIETQSFLYLFGYRANDDQSYIDGIKELPVEYGTLYHIKFAWLLGFPVFDPSHLQGDFSFYELESLIEDISIGEISCPYRVFEELKAILKAIRAFNPEVNWIRLQ